MKFKRLVSIFFFPLIAYGNLPDEYYKKNYVEISTEQLGEKYFHSYSFKDHKNNLTKWKWWIPARENDYKTDLFGIDLRYIEGNQIDIKAATDNYFVYQNNKIKLDYTATLNHFRDIAKPLYLKFKTHAKENQLTYREQIEFLLRFLQDFPYGIVPENFGQKYVNGLMPLSEIFKTGWSDCDSKSMLMAAILSFDEYFHDKLAMITVPGHALLGIEMIPRPFEKYVNFRGRKYVYAEPVGIVRTAFGRTNSPYSTSINVYPLEVFYFEKIENKANENLISLTNDDCYKDSLLIKYELDGIAYMYCTIKKAGEIVNHGPALIKYPDGRVVTKVYEMGIEKNE